MSKVSKLLSGIAFGMLAVVAPVMADVSVDGRIGRAELRFIEGMTDHHQMAIDMAIDCLARPDISEELRAECQGIIDSQQPEIEQMQAWLLAWYNVQYAPMSMSDHMAMMGNGMDHSKMEGMPETDPAMMMGMFAGFNRLKELTMKWLGSRPH